MPSKTGKTPASYYKSDVSVEQSTNVGFDSTTRAIISGDGAKSSMSASDDVLQVQPQNDDTGALMVKNVAGVSAFRVDTANLRVQCGASLVNATTQYAHFGVGSGDATWAGALADTHYAVPFANLASTTASSVVASLAMGTSTSSSFNDTNPADSLTISSTAMDIMGAYWYVMDDITIDAVKWFHGADTATGEDTAAHLMAYTVDIANGSTSGDLSSGVVVAGHDANGGGMTNTVTNAGYEQIYYQSLTIQSADVDAGKVILFTFASSAVNSDYSINATVKYHIR